MPSNKNKKHQRRAVTTTWDDKKPSRDKRFDRSRPKHDKDGGTTSFLIPFTSRFDPKSFEKWLQDNANKEAERHLSIRNVEYHKLTHMIRLTVSIDDVSLVKKICESARFCGQSLELRIESVNNSESASTRQSRIEQALKMWVQERYNAAASSLNLDSVSKHPDLSKRVDWTTADSGKALCNILQRFCTGCKEIILDNNDLNNLSLFSGIARACPTVERLSIAGNKISEFTQFDFIKNLRLRALRISGNPIAKLDTKMRLDEAKKYFPRLEMLDELQTSAMRFFDPSMLIDGVPLCELPLLKGSMITPELAPIAQGFVANYLSKLSNRATPVEALAAMYDQEAYMSISLSPELKLKQSQIVEFKKFNRNLCSDSSSKTVKDFIFCGPDQISRALKSLPVLTIPAEMLVCDAIDLTPFSQLPEVKTAGIRFFQLCFCGNATLDGEQFTFRRVFVLMLVGERLAIRNDMMTILPQLGKNVALDTGLVMSVSNREELTTRLSIETRIIPSAAKDALERCQWNFEAAAQMINTMRQQGQIAPNLCT